MFKKRPVEWLMGLCLSLSLAGAAGVGFAAEASSPALLALHAGAHALQVKPALAMMGTIDEDGFPQIRVISNLRNQSHAASKLTEGDDFSAYVVTRADSEKLKHLAENSNMSLYYQSGGEGLLLMGKGEAVNDVDTRRAVWDESFRRLGYSGEDDPMLAILRFTPERGKFYRQGQQNKLDLALPAQ